MANILNPVQKSPLEVVSSLNIKQEALNPYFFINLQKELKAEKVFSGVFSMDLSTVYSVARKVTLVALAIIGTGVILTTAFFAAPLLFPVILGVGLTFYKLAPLVLAPMEKLAHKHRLRKKNLEKACQIEDKLKGLSIQDLKKTYLTPLRIPSRLIIQGKKLEGENLKFFIIPILAKYLFWKESVKETETACETLKEEYQKVSDALLHDSDQTLPLKKVQKKQLELQALSLDYRIFDMQESDLPIIDSNGILPSALKAAYLLHIMQNPSEMKDLSDYGAVTPRQKYERELENIPSMKGYFLTKDGKRIDKTFFMANLERIQRIEKEVFAA